MGFFNGPHKNDNARKSTQRWTRGGSTEQLGPTFQIITHPTTTGADRLCKFNGTGDPK